MTPSELDPTIVTILFAGLGIAASFSFVRLVRGPSLADRVVALDLMALIAVGAIAVVAVDLRERVLLDSALALTLVAFLSTIVFSRYLEREGRDE